MAAALPQHSEFGGRDIFLVANGARLLLDASHSVAGEYWVIGIEGRHGDATPDDMAAVMTAWLATVRLTPALADHSPDAAIDRLFDDFPDETSEAIGTTLTTTIRPHQKIKPLC